MYCTSVGSYAVERADLPPSSMADESRNAQKWPEAFLEQLGFVAQPIRQKLGPARRTRLLTRSRIGTSRQTRILDQRYFPFILGGTRPIACRTPMLSFSSLCERTCVFLSQSLLPCSCRPRSSQDRPVSGLSTADSQLAFASSFGFSGPCPCPYVLILHMFRSIPPQPSFRLRRSSSFSIHM